MQLPNTIWRLNIAMKNVKPLIADLLEPNPKIFWADLLISAGGGWLALGFAVNSWMTNPLLACLLIFVSAMFFFRAIVFEHEIVHIKKSWIRPFEFVWNLLIGIPFFIPSVTYRSHLDHHRTKEYGTKGDPRYFFSGSQFRMAMLLPPLASPFAFLIIAFRYLVLGPLSLVIGGRLREWVVCNFGLQKINFRYKAMNLDPELKKSIFRSEVSCIAIWTIAIGLIASGFIPWLVLPSLAAVAMVIFVVNHFRAFAAHFYRSNGGESMTFKEQLEDSISIVGPCPFSALFAPVGLRFHSLHHLVPTIPYHAMRKAHHRLIESLPEDHPYHQTIRRDLVTTLIEIWRLHDPSKELQPAKSETFAKAAAPAKAAKA
jgi:fatty acid desaturase